MNLYRTHDNELINLDLMKYFYIREENGKYILRSEDNEYGYSLKYFDTFYEADSALESISRGYQMDEEDLIHQVIRALKDISDQLSELKAAYYERNDLPKLQ